MPIEIERKFLVKGPIVLPSSRQKILQGYLPEDTVLGLTNGTLQIKPMARGPVVSVAVSDTFFRDIRDYVLKPVGPRVLRIRITEGRPAIFCMKVSLRGSMSRIEIEVPVNDLDAMYLVQTCRAKVLSKTRYELDYDGKTWDVDIFSAPFNGLITAEIELLSESEPFTPPPWLGQEVTERPEFSNRALAEAQKIPALALSR